MTASHDFLINKEKQLAGNVLSPAPQTSWFSKWISRRKLNPQLLDACQKGQLARVRRLLNAGAELDHFDETAADRYFTALHAAVRGRHLIVLRELLRAGANPDILIDHPGYDPPLRWAAQAGLLDSVTELCSSGASIDPSSSGSYSPPLYWAARGGHLETVAYLIRMGAPLKPSENYPDTAPIQGDTTPLNAAAAQGQLQVVEELLKHGANPRFVSKCDTLRTVVRSFQNADVSLRHYLSNVQTHFPIMFGPDSNCRYDALDFAHLGYAYKRGTNDERDLRYKEIIRLLESHGAERNVKIPDSETVDFKQKMQEFFTQTYRNKHR